MGRGAGVKALVVAALVLVAAACSGTDSGAEDNPTSPSTTAPATAEATVTTQAPAASEQSGAAEYSVLMLANIDQLTAEATFGSLEEAGITGFVLVGSAEEGFDLYRSGLTYDEATAVITEIVVAPGVNGGVIFETANLP